MELQTARQVRLAARAGTFRSPTAGLCPDNVQANLIVLPAKYASDFLTLCQRNPVSCPLIKTSPAPGDWTFTSDIAGDVDIRTDAPGYNVYENGKLVASDISDINAYWRPDSVAFLIGCSFSFEAALCDNGLVPRHMELGTNVAMYRTSTKLFPAGVFGGNMVVSMRPYRPEDIEKVRNITRSYGRTHGEPIAWGWVAAESLGITDILTPDFGDVPTLREGEIPVFWGCGVTPQLSIMGSPEVEGIVIGHAPGKMVCLDMEVSHMLGKL